MELSSSNNRKQGADRREHAVSFISRWSDMKLSNWPKLVPSMMINEEKELLCYLASEVYEGRGVIVDAGLYLGASTLALCDGLERSGKTQLGFKPIHSYELGICDHVMAQTINWSYKTDLKPNDSFISILRENLKEAEYLVSMHIGDIQDADVSIFESIEIMFYDCGKTALVNDSVAVNFFRKLLPGAILVQQDYYHEWLPWIHLSMGQVIDKFDYLGNFGSSAVFQLREDISSFEFVPFEEIDLDRSLVLMDKCRSITEDPGLLYMLDLAKSVLFVLKGARATGLQLINSVTTVDPKKTKLGFKCPEKERVHSWIVRQSG